MRQACSRTRKPCWKPSNKNCIRSPRCAMLILSAIREEKMRVAVVFLYAFLTLPMVLDIRFSTDDRTMIRGNIRLRIGAVVLHAPFHVEQQKFYYLRIGSTLRIRVSFGLKKRKKPSSFLIRNLKSWLDDLLFVINIRLGTGNACSTALCCGALHGLFSILPQAIVHIKPQYDQAGYFLQVHCIAVFRLGKLFLTAAMIALDHLSAKGTGGRANGNHAKQANQLRHANGP